GDVRGAFSERFVNALRSGLPEWRLTATSGHGDLFVTTAGEEVTVQGDHGVAAMSHAGGARVPCSHPPRLPAYASRQRSIALRMAWSSSPTHPVSGGPAAAPSGGLVAWLRCRAASS